MTENNDSQKTGLQDSSGDKLKRNLLREIINITPAGVSPRVMLHALIAADALPQIASEIRGHTA